MRCCLLLPALLMIGGCGSLNAMRPAPLYKPLPAKSEAEAVKAAQLWRKALGLKELVGVAAVSMPDSSPLPSQSKDDWVVAGKDDKGRDWKIVVSHKTGRVSEAHRISPVFLTANSTSRYFKGEDAMRDIAQMIEPIIKGKEVTLTSFHIGSGMTGSSLRSSGVILTMQSEINAEYGLLNHGRPYFRGFYGISVALDPSTGELTGYRENLDAPATSGSPIPLILPIQAIAAAEKSAGVKPGKFAHAPAILGWAVPTGGREAKLFYLIDGSDGKVIYNPLYVSAESGRIDAGLSTGGALTVPTGGSIYHYTLGATKIRPFHLSPAPSKPSLQNKSLPKP